MKKILGIVLLGLLFIGCGADSTQEKKYTEISPAKELATDRETKEEARERANNAILKLMKAGEKGTITDRLENPKKAY